MAEALASPGLSEPLAPLARSGAAEVARAAWVCLRVVPWGPPLRLPSPICGRVAPLAPWSLLSWAFDVLSGPSVGVGRLWRRRGRRLRRSVP